MKNNRKTAAVILAAGCGRRMGTDVAKQYITLLGQTVLYHTVHAFAQAATVDVLCLVIREEDRALAEEATARCKKPLFLCIGADTRQGSARCGVMALPADVDYVAIHDGARCLVTPSVIDDTIRAAWKHNAACAVERPVDTVKEVDNMGQIIATHDREKLRLAQTPQVFARDLYMRALAHAEQQGLSVTDDCALVEALGVRVHAVMHEEDNFKVTYKRDLMLAECILKQRGERL